MPNGYNDGMIAIQITAPAKGRIWKNPSDKANANKLIKANKSLLVHWESVMDNCLSDKEPKQFLGLKKVGDFIDGFMIQAPKDLSGQ